MGNIGNSHAFLKYLLSIEPQLRRSKCTWLYGALEKLWQSSVTHKSDIKEVLWSQEGGLESFSLNKEPSIPCGLEQIFNQLHFMQGFKPKRFWDRSPLSPLSSSLKSTFHPNCTMHLEGRPFEFSTFTATLKADCHHNALQRFCLPKNQSMFFARLEGYANALMLVNNICITMKVRASRRPETVLMKSFLLSTAIVGEFVWTLCSMDVNLSFPELLLENNCLRWLPACSQGLHNSKGPRRSFQSTNIDVFKVESTS